MLILVSGGSASGKSEFAEGLVAASGLETRAYLDGLARLNRAVAQRADRVYEVVCGIPIAWKGANP